MRSANILSIHGVNAMKAGKSKSAKKSLARGDFEAPRPKQKKEPLKSGAKKTTSQSSKKPKVSRPNSSRSQNLVSDSEQVATNRLFRPDRLKYVTQKNKSEGCVFCACRELGVGAKSLLLFRNQLVMVVINKFPYNPGHLLVLPAGHVGELSDLSTETSSELMRLTRISVDILKKAYNPTAFNLGMNLGAVSGAGIPEHLHMHVVPRWAGDTNFFPVIARTKVIPETLEQTWERLNPYFLAGV
jgi:ATP adenylyltransferase